MKGAAILIVDNIKSITITWLFSLAIFIFYGLISQFYPSSYRSNTVLQHLFFLSQWVGFLLYLNKHALFVSITKYSFYFAVVLALIQIIVILTFILQIGTLGSLISLISLDFDSTYSTSSTRDEIDIAYTFLLAFSIGYPTFFLGRRLIKKSRKRKPAPKGSKQIKKKDYIISLIVFGSITLYFYWPLDNHNLTG